MRKTFWLTYSLMSQYHTIMHNYLSFFQITILITDGKSQDNVQEPSQRLRSLGVKIFAVGKNCANI